MSERVLVDQIGRQEIVDKIGMLVDRLEVDNQFCLALNGAWGSGKSFVMQMLQSKFAKHSEYVVINYDAWKNNFYSDPLIAMLCCVLDGIKEYVNKSWEFLSKIEGGAKKTFSEWSDKILSEMKAAGGKLSLFAHIVEAIKNVANSSGKLVKNDFRVKDYTTYQSLLEKVKEQLNSITKEKIEEKQIKLIIMVDEVDRCLPNEQLIVLERLHHLFEVNNCAVIVALNQESVAKSVNALYGIDGDEYLRKFFDYSYTLEMASEVYLEKCFSMFRMFLENRNIAIDWKDSFVCAYRCLCYGDYQVLKAVDNREIKRYCNALSEIFNSFGWENLTKEYVFFVIIGLYIKKYLAPDFLSEKDVIEKQESIGRVDVCKETPYYDYLKNFIGVDRKALSQEVRGKYYESNIPKYSFSLNEMIYYSIAKNFSHNALRNFIGASKVFPEDCAKLRDLILLFGGEAKRIGEKR